MTSQSESTMDNFSESVSLDQRSKKRGVLLLRWLLIIVTCCLIIFGGRTSGYDQFLMLILILSNVMLSHVPERIFHYHYFDYALIMSDTLLVSVGIIYAGLGDSDLFLIYFAIILLATLGRSFKVILINTLIVIFLYYLVVFKVNVHGSPIDTQFYLRIPFLFIVSLFYGFLVELLKNERARVEEVSIENREIRNLEKKKTEFIGAIAHNLRTPLTTIKSYADYLISNNMTIEEYQNFIRIISREIDQLSAIIDQFLDLTRIESGESVTG